MRLYQRGRCSTRAPSSSGGGASRQHDRRPSHDELQRRRSFSPLHLHSRYSSSSPELQHSDAHRPCSQSSKESGSRSLGMRSTEARPLGRNEVERERCMDMQQSTRMYGHSRGGYGAQEEELGRQQLRRKAPAPRDQQRPTHRLPSASAPDPIASSSHAGPSHPTHHRHSRFPSHLSVSHHRRASSPPPPFKPRPRPPPPPQPGLTKSPQVFGYQLELPSLQLVPFLIGPRGDRSSAIREPAELLELTLGYLTTTLTPVARLQGTYSSIRRGVQGIHDCLRQHPNQNVVGDLEGWCEWDPRAMWDMGVSIEMYGSLPSKKKGGVVRPMEGLELGHPFAEGMVTRLPERAEVGMEVAIRQERRKRRCDDSEEYDRERNASRRAGSDFNSTSNYAHGYYEDPVCRSGRPLPPPRLPSPPPFSRSATKEIDTKPLRSSSPIPAPKAISTHTRLSSASTYTSDLPSSTSRETISTEAHPLDSSHDDAQQALQILCNLHHNQRMMIWGVDPLRSTFNSREVSPAFAEALDRERRDEALQDPRRLETYEKEGESSSSTWTTAGERERWRCASRGECKHAELEEGEICSSRAGSIGREDQVSEDDPGIIRDRTSEEEEEGSQASPLTDEGDDWEQDVKMADESHASYMESLLASKLTRIERSASVVSFLDYNC